MRYNFLIVLALLLSFHLRVDAQFYAVGDLPGAGFFSELTALSEDGSTAVGHSMVGHSMISPVTNSGVSHPAVVAFRWTRDGGIESIGDLAGSREQGRALAVSEDGNAIVGTSRASNYYRNFLWTNETGMVAVEDIDPRQVQHASVIRNFWNGYLIAGVSWPKYLSDEDTALMIYLPNQPASWIRLLENALFGHARVVDWTADAGTFLLNVTTAGEANYPVLSSNNTIEELLIHDRPDRHVVASAMTRDASRIVGHYESDEGRLAFLWDREQATSDLPSLEGGYENASAHAISGAGDIIVGYSTSWKNREATIWLFDEDMLIALSATELLSDVLPEGWDLVDIVGISGDGNVICGNGWNSDGLAEGWIFYGLRMMLEDRPSGWELLTDWGNGWRLLGEFGFISNRYLPYLQIANAPKQPEPFGESRVYFPVGATPQGDGFWLIDPLQELVFFLDATGNLIELSDR